jgi:putative heme-binding domain-containing protein
MSYKTTILLFISMIIAFTGCTQTEQDPEIKTVSDEQARSDMRETAESIATETPDDLSVSLWGTTDLLGDPIGIDMDDSGKAWVTVTSRSRNSEFDIRDVDGSWLIESMKWETVEDRRAFLHDELAPEKSDQNEWLWDHNNDGKHDWTDLAVISEEVWTVEDASGDGLADRSQLFIRDFNSEVTDVAGTVLNHNGDVFIGVGPDMWRTRDTNSDGMSDWKESISHGYNVHIGFSGHGMSGATVGPDGRIYWGIGDMGFSVTDKEGKRWHYPNQGAILRSEPDGSNFEVYAAGVRNTHEFVFDKYGNLITVDNDGDHAGEFERLVYLVNGSDSGWRTNWQFGKYTDDKNNDYKVWMDENYFRPRWDGQAAHILPPLKGFHPGPAGMVYNPGTALNDSWDDHFFVMSFRGSVANSPIYAFTLQENGASYEMASEQEALKGVLAVGLDFGPDGALYMTDWIRGWGQKDQGRIWKLDDEESAGSEARLETRQLLEDSFEESGSDMLIDYMGHDDMRVRQKAQFELADRGDAESLQSAAEESDVQLARIHGIWGLAQMGRESIESVDPLIGLLNDADYEIRAQAAKWLGDVRYSPAAEPIVNLLQDDHPRVRFFAAEALGRMEYCEAFDDLVQMLDENNDEDVYLRHAGAIALARFGDGEALADLSDHNSEAVRIAAVVALKRLQHPGSARFLNDESEYVVTNAARAISDDAFVDEAMPNLAGLLDDSRFDNEPLIRRIINANLYSGTAEDAQRLMRFATDLNNTESMRIEALRTLRYWEEPSIFDRVTGRHRGEVQNSADDAQNALASVADQLLTDPAPAIQIAAIETIAELELTDFTGDIYTLVSDGDSPDVRAAALRGLRKLGFDEIDEAIRLALNDSEESVRMTATLMIPNLDIDDETAVALLEAAFQEESVEQKQTVLLAFADLDTDESYRFLNDQITRLSDGDLLPAVHVDLMETVENLGSDELKSRLDEYLVSKESEDGVTSYSEVLYGGDAGEGGRVFYNNAAAQCIRCHAVDGSGGDVGPEITAVANRLSREALLESLVAPSARISPGYGVVSATLTSGETIQGALREETDDHYVISVGNNEQTVQKSMIESVDITPSSMPAMGDLLTRRELRDLVEFLTTLDGPSDTNSEEEIESH